MKFNKLYRDGEGAWRWFPDGEPFGPDNCPTLGENLGGIGFGMDGVVYCVYLKIPAMPGDFETLREEIREDPKHGYLVRTIGRQYEIFEGKAKQEWLFGKGIMKRLQAEQEKMANRLFFSNPLRDSRKDTE